MNARSRLAAGLSSFALVFVFVGFAACSSAETSDLHEDIEASTSPENSSTVVKGTGTIRFMEFEGGFYGIIADDSTRYDPGQMEAKFEQDGLRVRFELTPRKDVMTMRQWGTPADVHSIEEIDSE